MNDPLKKEPNEIKNFVPELWAGMILEQHQKNSVIFDHFYETVERTWKERLFSFHPFKKYKVVSLYKIFPDGVGSDTIKINKVD